MERIIKFRAYDTRNKIMIDEVCLGLATVGFPVDEDIAELLKKYGFDLDADNIPENWSDTGEDWLYILEDYKVVQFTGLHYYDKKEIYEGDIFSNGVCDWLVKFEQGCFVAEPIGKLKHLQHTAQGTGEKINLALRAIHPKGGLVYVGNVFENSELLK